MSVPDNNPYLSIVIVSRNDDHQGDMLQRMKVSTGGLLRQLEKYKIDSELILVEWNPPANRPLLKDAFKWPDRMRHCTVRVIIVPAEIHSRYKEVSKRPLIREIAVNCGIRRARGQFILPGNIDLLYSDELMSFIASRTLERDAEYRVSRCDVDRNVVQYDTSEERLDFCRNNITLINSYEPRPHRRWWFQNNLPDLHTNAAGDFQLMSMDYWHLLRGYSENHLLAYGDGLFCYMVYAAGVREVILNEPMCLYHIDHDDKFNGKIKRAKLPLENWLSLSFMPEWFNNKIIALYRRFLMLFGYKLKSSVDGIPVLDYTEYRKMAIDMVSGKRPYYFNDENWGLGQDSLEEFVISTADWDKDYGRNQ